MKNQKLISLLALVFSLFLAVQGRAVVFSGNTDISPVNTNYDGEDIVISNCTVTVDGAHTFASLTVTSNGVLTHSFSPGGQFTNTVNVTNEQQTLNGTTPVTLDNSNIFSPILVTDLGQTVVYTNGIDYDETNLTGGVVEIVRTATSSIPDGATVLVDYSWDLVVDEGLDLTVTGAVSVAVGSSINVNAIGYGGGLGQGAGRSSGSTYFDGSGGGDGGNGGMSASNAVGGICYDSLYQPGLMGSGGGASYAGSGGNGGGLIQIVAAGNMDIEGAVSANGGNAMNDRAGGGSGGGIWISAASVSGTGTITANGGAGAPGFGGGGGGGRIAIVCGANNFSGSMTAYGGSGATYGGAGTIFTQLTGQTGSLLLNNGGHTGTNSTVTLSNLADVIVSGNAGLIPSGSFYPRNVTIGANSFFTTLSQSLLNVAMSNLTVQAGGLLSVNGLGGGNAQGGGGTYTSGSITYGGGGGHGGYGGAGFITNANGGTFYDIPMSPTQLGSIGGGGSGTSFGGAGGGSVELNISGTLEIDGTVTANGNNGSGNAGGGGSGGSIYLTAGTISGAGVITANGGVGANSLGGGGAGGCIAIISRVNSFAGAVNCYGGAGANPGGAGTIYLQTAGGTPELLLDNGGIAGPRTPVQNVNNENLIIQNGASGMGGTGLTSVNSLLVASNASLTLYGGTSSGGFVAGNATIQAGGGLIADSQGYPANQGSGSGAGGYSTVAPSYPGGGGGYGGMGGNSTNNLVTGGHAGYENITQPALPGAGGGGYSPYSIGGSGGGNVQMGVVGKLQLNGVISANGGNGSGVGGGGGAGGTINLSAGILSGNGSISANGGTGANSIGGGGGGGCIYITYSTNTFSGPITAFGGGGAFYGGAGTVFLHTNSTGQGLLLVDNGGDAGAGTIIQSISTANLTVRNSALIVMAAGSFSFGNILMSSNALWVVTNNGPLIIAANNVTVQSGCSISANAAGYTANEGPGAGRFYDEGPEFPGSGAGNGGYGANSATNTSLGGQATFGSQSSPTTPGSGGGGEGPQYSSGGSGGGVIEMNVSTLQLNGTLSANGANGGGSGGGGSGGSLQLNIGDTFTGSGVVSANGGSGANSIGGGGGGGMIAINIGVSSFLTNSFNGAISAYGGGGANYGGAGTIFIKTNVYSQSEIIVDNGGNIGTNTGIAFSSVQNGLILRNGAIGCLNVSPQDFSSVLITSNAWLVPKAINNTGTVSLSCDGNVTIQAGGGIIADSYGSAQNVGTGHGNISQTVPFYPGSGGGHGGYGGGANSNVVLGGVAYDSTTSPNLTGSGGGGYLSYSAGGSGGAYIDLVVESPFIITNNGVISANGGNGSGSGGGGGSGGSIAITTRTLAGIGSITANGGNGASNVGGGGGGGRVAIFINQGPFSKTNLFGGTITAYGGGGANYGGAGTVYYLTNLANFFPTVVLDNNGHVGTNTSFAFNNYDVTVQNGAIGLLPSSGSWTAHNILILSNSAMTVLPTTANITLQPNSLTIAQDGALSLDGGGYGAQSGPGNGASDGGTYGGAGHGGYGGGDFQGNGGNAYDSVVAPANAGSGGANYSSVLGGTGGGTLTIGGGAITVNGRLSANGTSGGLNAGGGAGGSLNLITLPTTGNSGFAGNGVISANGGTASGMGGGGGGGRIAIIATSNNFTGQYSVYGGGGNYPGGAGTIYTSINGIKTLLVNNGGSAGTNTPLTAAFSLPSTPFDLDISGAAYVSAFNPLLLSNLNLSAATTLNMSAVQTSLFIGVLNNANIGGNLNVDIVGYPMANGPGAGSAINNDGSGGGYGGTGGASSSGAIGGVTYGSAPEPLAFGSGGGNGTATVSGGSSGGGALRLSVLGTLNVTGNISANGNAGAQDNSGGGSGGSVWITAGALSGSGSILANGGDGALFGGGGGGGGRIAIYTPSNNFTGMTNVSGGTGDVFGQPGTIFLGNAFTDFEIISQSPTGQVVNTISSVNLGFNDMVNPASISASDFTLVTPAGPLASSNLSVTVTGPTSVQLSFPIPNLSGNYTIEAATTISNMFGTPLAVPYAGTFSVLLPTIYGTVTDTNGAPVVGVLIQPNGGLTGVMTDTNGNYSLGVPNGWNGTVTPSLGTNMFVPGSISYGNVTINLTNQNYLMVATVAPNIASSASGGNFTLSWTGITYVTYQVLWSPDLINWQPLGSAIPGTNGPMQVVLPTTNSTAYFIIQATH